MLLYLDSQEDGDVRGALSRRKPATGAQRNSSSPPGEAREAREEAPPPPALPPAFVARGYLESLSQRASCRRHSIIGVDVRTPPYLRTLSLSDSLVLSKAGLCKARSSFSSSLRPHEGGSRAHGK